MKYFTLQVFRVMALCAPCGVYSQCAAGSPFRMSSPDGCLEVRTDAADAALRFEVRYVGARVAAVEVPRGEPAAVVDCGIVSNAWENKFGERRNVTDEYRLYEIGNVEMRLYDAGVAWRLKLRGDGKVAFASEEAMAVFSFGGDWRCWPVSHNQGIYRAFRLSDFATMKPKPSFAPVATGLGKMYNYENDILQTAEGPFVVEGDGFVAALGEAANTDFAKIRFGAGRGANSVVALLEGCAEAELPYATPWYYVRVASTPSRLYAGNDMLLNLNEPSRIADTSWIRPGKVLRVAKLDTQTCKDAVDFVLANGMQYIELDCGWYGQEHTGDPLKPGLSPEKVAKGEVFDLFEILAYAKGRGVPVILYVNREPLKRTDGGIDEILPTLKRWGVAGVKYGFVNVGSQRWNKWMSDAIAKGAANGLMLDAHDEYRLTGQQRTWPNILTVEGIAGNEEMPDASHNAALVFTRYLAGPGDYTPCWKVARVKNSLAHQLALGVATFSPWQFLFWYQRPGQIDAQNPALAVWKEMPTVWDDSVALDGEIGEYAVVARRTGEKWFVGALNANERRDIRVPLSFLGDGKWHMRLYRDADANATNALAAIAIDERIVSPGDTVDVPSSPNGGFAAIFERTE